MSMAHPAGWIQPAGGDHGSVAGSAVSESVVSVRLQWVTVTVHVPVALIGARTWTRQARGVRRASLGVQFG